MIHDAKSIIERSSRGLFSRMSQRGSDRKSRLGEILGNKSLTILLGVIVDTAHEALRYTELHSNHSPHSVGVIPTHVATFFFGISAATAFLETCQCRTIM